MDRDDAWDMELELSPPSEEEELGGEEAFDGSSELSPRRAVARECHLSKSSLGAAVA